MKLLVSPTDSGRGRDFFRDRRRADAGVSGVNRLLKKP
jgi:hypothetical protein